MWAHAHGMITLYHHGHFRMDEATFRSQFEDSGARMMRGTATDEFAAELTAHYVAEAPAGMQG